MRLRTWLLLAFALSLVVAACGDDGGTTTTTAAVTTTAAATTTEAAGLETIQPGILTIGSDVPYPPMEDFDAEGNVIGFDADLMNEIARRLGLEPRWIDTDFDTIFTQLAQGQFDVVASATTITEEREKMVDFSTRYFNSNQALTVNTNETPDIASVDDLQSGDAVAVQTGTTGEIWAKENLEPRGIIIRSFVQPPDCFTAIDGGQAVAGVLDIDTSLDAEAKWPALKVVQEIVTGEGYGFPVNPANPALLAAVNAALEDMKADGFYQQAYDTWLTRPGGSVLYEAP